MSAAEKAGLGVESLVMQLEEYSRAVACVRAHGVEIVRELKDAAGDWSEVECIVIRWEHVGDVCAFLARAYDGRVNGTLPWSSP